MMIGWCEVVLWLVVAFTSFSSSNSYSKRYQQQQQQQPQQQRLEYELEEEKDVGGVVRASRPEGGEPVDGMDGVGSNDDDQTCAERSRGKLIVVDNREFDRRENEAAIRVGGGQLRS
eukprot:scaffold6166_cov85-Skeletonema_dohrnii-CCMP3373.AAC.2